MKINKQAEVNEKLLKSIAERYGLTLVVIFGSHAKGASLPESDVDVGVMIRKEKWPYSDSIHKAEMEMDLMEALAQAIDSPDGLDVVILNDVESLLLFQVAKYGIPVYQAEPYYFWRFQSYASRRYDEDRHYFKLRRDYLRKVYSYG